MPTFSPATLANEAGLNGVASLLWMSNDGPSDKSVLLLPDSTPQSVYVLNYTSDKCPANFRPTLCIGTARTYVLELGFKATPNNLTVSHRTE